MPPNLLQQQPPPLMQLMLLLQTLTCAQLHKCIAFVLNIKSKHLRVAVLEWLGLFCLAVDSFCRTADQPAPKVGVLKLQGIDLR